MNWELFYLICFVVGFAFTALSFLSGTLHLHLPGHFHFGGYGTGTVAGHMVGIWFLQSHEYRGVPGVVWRDWLPAGPSAPHLGICRAGFLDHCRSDWGGSGDRFFATKYLMAHESSLDPWT